MTMDNQDLKDTLWRLYEDHYTQVRHYETQRSTVTNLLLTIAAALLAFITYDKAAYLVPHLALNIMSGLPFHYNRLMMYRNKLDDLAIRAGIVTTLAGESGGKTNEGISQTI